MIIFVNITARIYGGNETFDLCRLFNCICSKNGGFVASSFCVCESISAKDFFGYLLEVDFMAETTFIFEIFEDHS